MRKCATLSVVNDVHSENFVDLQQRRKDAAAKAETLAEEQRLRLLEKERLAEANRVEVPLNSKSDDPCLCCQYCGHALLSCACATHLLQHVK